MPRERSAHSWLNTVSTLLGSRHDRPPSRIRRLRAEALEDRTVLSTAALPTTPAPGMSLDQYLALEHPMGPIAPSAAAIADLSSTDNSSSDSLAATVVSPQSIDQWFAAAEGEGEGGGGGSGSGGGSAAGSGSGSSASSGSGSTAGSGSGSNAGSGSGSNAGSGSGGGTGSGSGSGAGSGSGSGAGSGSGSGGSSGSSSGSDSEDPTISTNDIYEEDGVITVNGAIGDNSGVNGLTMTLDGGQGSITINEDGTFTLSITDTQGNDTFTLTVTDESGNTTTYTFNYYT
jgi:hypothetical protein